MEAEVWRGLDASNFCKVGKTNEWCGSVAEGLLHIRRRVCCQRCSHFWNLAVEFYVLVHQQFGDPRASLSTERGHFITGHGRVAAKLLLCDLKLSWQMEKNSAVLFWLVRIILPLLTCLGFGTCGLLQKFFDQALAFVSNLKSHCASITQSASANKGCRWSVFLINQYSVPWKGPSTTAPVLCWKLLEMHWRVSCHKSMQAFCGSQDRINNNL